MTVASTVTDAATGASLVVDVWAQQPTERFMSAPWLETLVRWTGLDGPGISVRDTLDAMDASHVDIALLSAWGTPQGMLIDNDEVAAVVQQAPDRFKGVGSVDLRDPVRAVREIRRCVDDLGFVGVRVVPWVWDLPPDDWRYYPVYVACVEASVPFCTQLDHTSPLGPAEPGRPIPYLDRVLLDFPELVVIGGHVSYPWVHEALSLAREYSNFFIDTSAYALHRLPLALTEFMRGRGRTRVLFGTNWPMISPARCLAGLDALGLDDEARRLFLGGNATRIFRLA